MNLIEQFGMVAQKTVEETGRASRPSEEGSEEGSEEREELEEAEEEAEEGTEVGTEEIWPSTRRWRRRRESPGSS